MSLHPIPNQVQRAINRLGERAQVVRYLHGNCYFLDGQKVPFTRLIEAAGLTEKLTPFAGDLL